MPPTAMPFPRLQIAQIDGQGQPTLRKQAHLRRMFETLTRSASTITLAIQSDSSHSAKEVKLELSLALFELKSLYESLDLAADLRSSQDVPLNQNNLARMRPTGIVYIVPTKHCLFYSAISPVAAAIAAGNAVILELPQTLSQTSSILRKLLTESLDSDIFAIATQRPSAIDFTIQCTLVLQEEADVDTSRWSQILRSPSSAPSVAVVDRTADLLKAANAVAHASFSFQGRSPYRPRLVVVNEFIADQFLSALMGHVHSTPTRASKELGSKPTKTRAEAGDVELVVAGSNGRIVELKTRESAALLQSFESPTIAILRVSSLDAAIDLFAGSQAMAACYTFGNLEEANYVTTYIKASLSYINHIPASLMLGPVAPAHSYHRAASSPRYSPTLFSQPSPQYLHATSTLDLAFVDEKGFNDFQAFSAQIMKPIPNIKRPSGFLLNYFGTGIVLSLSTVLLSVVGASGGFGWYLYKKSHGLQY